MIQKNLLTVFSILSIILPAAKCQPIDQNENANDLEMEVILLGRDGETDITKTADYLNGKIKHLLEENPSKNSAKYNLAATFNAARSELENAFINETATEEAIKAAEQALEDFKTFLQHYRKVEGMLEAAQQDLNDYETDPTRTIEEKYEALKLLLKIRNCSTLEEAEEVLKLYQDFKNGGGTMPDNESNLSSLSDEHKNYFEEILKILKDHFIKDSAEMENFLNQVLKSPELLKKLYEALRIFSEEEEDDFLMDLWSLIF